MGHIIALRTKVSTSLIYVSSVAKRISGHIGTTPEMLKIETIALTKERSSGTYLNWVFP